MVFFLNQLAHYWCAPAHGCALQLALCCGGGGGGGDGGGGGGDGCIYMPDKVLVKHTNSSCGDL